VAELAYAAGLKLASFCGFNSHQVHSGFLGGKQVFEASEESSILSTRT
jgi:hypothetical protein